MLRSLFHFTELLINDSAIRKPITPWNDPDLRRFETYHRCLTSIQAWLDIFFSIPLTVSANLPFTTYQNLIRVLTSLHGLTTINDPAWDKGASHETLELIPTCDRIIDHFEILRTLYTSSSPNDYPDESWSFAIRIITALRSARAEDLLAPRAYRITAQLVNGFQNGSYGDFWMSDMFTASWGR